MNPDPLRAEGTDWQRDYTVKTIDCGIAECGWRGVEHVHSGLRRDPEPIASPHPDTPWLLLAAVIVFVALGILVAVKR